MGVYTSRGGPKIRPRRCSADDLTRNVNTASRPDKKGGSKNGPFGGTRVRNSKTFYQ